MTSRGFGAARRGLASGLVAGLVLALGLATGTAAGESKGESDESNAPAAGRWRKVRTNRFDQSLTEEQRERIRQLEALGYVSGSVEFTADEIITVHHRARTSPGLNFYTSGHAPEAILMDMDGNEIHRWHQSFRDVWPDHPIEERTNKTEFWRRAHVYENGDILAIFEGLGLVKLDRNSNLIWADASGQHHDLDVLPNGDIYVLTREARLVPRVGEDEPILEDFVAIMSPEGRVKAEISLLECFENSDFPEIWPGARSRDHDVFHTNSLEVLDGRASARDPVFRAGRVLTSMRYLDAIAVVDLEEKKVVWARTGSYRMQHDPTLVEGGRVLLFDNVGRSGASRVMELDPTTMQTRWEYRGAPDAPFRSRTCGTAQRLPNGNTLITESDGGRAFEVDGEGEIVWEFFNPHRAGKNGEFIATLFEVVRLGSDFSAEWARGAP